MIRTVNIITNSGAPASDLENCAADVNLDGSVNVLDVLVIVNIILDERISSRDRSNEEILKEVEFISYENSLEISSNGKIKGVQLLVESEDDLEFTYLPNMEIFYKSTYKIPFKSGFSLSIKSSKSFT